MISFEKNKKGIVLIIIAALFTVLGQYFWKLSHANNIEFVIIGFLFYGIGAVGMIIAFKFGSFSVLHPMMSINYIFTILLAYFTLGESINLYKIIGLLFIMIGITCVGVGDE